MLKNTNANTNIKGKEFEVEFRPGYYEWNLYINNTLVKSFDGFEENLNEHTTIKELSSFVAEMVQMTKEEKEVEWDEEEQKEVETEMFTQLKNAYNVGSYKTLHISMAYTFVGDTSIDIPIELLEGRTKEEQLKIAYEYAQEHVDEIPVAENSEYIPYSDNFDFEDVNFED